MNKYQGIERRAPDRKPLTNDLMIRLARLIGSGENPVLVNKPYLRRCGTRAAHTQQD